jgi:eukaryotic-like serine/threonine-protein kinase
VVTDRLIDGRYRLGSELGSGGMATVHRAWDTRLERAVAVKLYRPSDDRAEHRRFHDEARTLAGLSHPGLVTVYDSGIGEDGPYLVMRLVEGGTLRRRIVDGPMPPHEVRGLGTRLADALAAVHAGGVVHRDVKPSNVLLDGAGAPHLADFGVSLTAGAARLTATGQFLGTAAYLAPEQALGRPVGPPVDVYALGLVLLECLTGRTEYTGTDVEAVVARLYRAPCVPADVPADLAALITAMTDLDPAARPTAAGCAAALAAPPPDATARPTPAPARAVTGVLPLAAVGWPAAAPVRLAPQLGPGRRFTGIAAGLAVIVAAMTWALAGHDEPGRDPAGPTLVGVVPAGQELTTTPSTAPPAPPVAPQVVTEVVTVVVPQPAPAAERAEPRQGKEKRGDRDDEGDDGDDGDDD